MEQVQAPPGPVGAIRPPSVGRVPLVRSLYVANWRVSQSHRYRRDLSLGPRFPEYF